MKPQPDEASTTLDPANEPLSLTDLPLQSLLLPQPPQLPCLTRLPQIVLAGCLQTPPRLCQLQATPGIGVGNCRTVLWELYDWL